jgi:signal transduction histidine kinase/DNA-binding NarL/FixJ family response regulator
MSNTTIIPRHRLLIIDDNPTIHEDIKKILCPAAEDHGLNQLADALFGSTTRIRAHKEFQIDSAFQGQEGLAKVQAAIAESRPYTLAFVDVRMPPGWDGIETIRRIWDTYPDLQVVICTAYSDHSWEDIIAQLGQSDSLVILKKPFDNIEVLQLAHALTKKWSLTREARFRMDDLDELVQRRTEALSFANQKLQAEIRQRVEVEVALRASEELFQKAFTAASVPMVVLQTENHACLEVNSSFLQLVNRTRFQVIGKGLDSLDIFINPQESQAAFAELTAYGSARNHKCRIRDTAETVHDTLLSLQPVSLAGKACILAAIQDVTEQLHLEARLRQSQKLEAIGQLAAGVEHDFNNLLTIIHGHTSLQMCREDLDKEVTYSLNQVKMAADRAAALTKQLLAFSRKQLVKLAPMDLSEIVNRIHPMLARMVGEAIELQTECPAGLPAVLADEHCVEQIVMNLVVNARDATPKGGKIFITVQPVEIKAKEHANPDARDGRFLKLSVADNGTGIDTLHLSHLFEPFFTTKDKGKGTGLGLSTVYGIAQQHDGWVEVKSKKGQGSVFEVFLPASNQAVAPRHETEFSNKIFTRPKRAGNVLLVEDEEALRGFITDALSQCGYNVIQAGDGIEAQIVFRTSLQPVDILITDMVMPNGITGRELACQLLDCQPDLKVLYMSGYSTDLMENADRLTEGENFLPKPFNIPQLISTVERCLQSESAVTLQAASTG